VLFKEMFERYLSTGGPCTFFYIAHNSNQLGALILLACFLFPNIMNRVDMLALLGATTVLAGVMSITALTHPQDSMVAAVINAVETNETATVSLDGLATCSLLGDVNQDGVVDESDIAVIKTNFGRTADQGIILDQYADLNGDGIIDLKDFNILAAEMNNEFSLADINGDGIVNRTDADIVSINVGRKVVEGYTFIHVDINGDGRIDTLDFNTVVANQGTTCNRAVLAAATVIADSGNSVSASCIPLIRPLQRGMSGDDVASLQRLLGMTEITGYFGSLTEAAVKKFQAEKGIASFGTPETTGYGMVGPKTRAQLPELVCADPNIATYEFRPVPTLDLKTGQNVIYRMKITAPKDKPFLFSSDTFFFSQTGNQLGDIYLIVFRDSTFTNQLGEAVVLQGYNPNAAGTQTLRFSPRSPQTIPAGESRYIEVRTRVLDMKDVASIIMGHKGLDDVTLRNPKGKYIDVLSPNGQKYEAGQTIRVSFVSNLPVGTSYDVIVGGKAYESNVGSGKIISGINTVNIVAPKDMGYTGDAQVEVRAACDKLKEAVCVAKGFGKFTIVSPPTPSITVLSPNGGEILKIGSVVRIEVGSFTSLPLYNFALNLQSADGSENHGQITSCDSSSNIYQQDPNNPAKFWFNWRVGYDMPGKIPDGMYRIAAVHCKDGNDMSDAPFTITSATQPSITVLSPNGGEQWVIGNKNNVKFQHSNLDGAEAKLHLVKQGQENGTACLLKYITFSKDVASVEVDLTKGCLNSAEFGKIVPGNYKIQINVGNFLGQDSSDNYFTITSSSSQPSIPPSCSLTSNRSSYKYGEIITFSWTSKNATYASFKQDTSGKDYLWVPSDKLFPNGSQSVTANVTGSPTVTLLVGGPGGTNTCSTTVNITPSEPSIMASIRVLSPNGGETLKAGTSHVIKWSSTSIGSTDNVRISLYKAGSHVRTITTSTPNDGSHTWNIAADQWVGNDYVIRITKVGDDALRDVSDRQFSIVK
jgi:peptidoglycan hydrolase-like protein with peptidoglycan-binding domain